MHSRSVTQCPAIKYKLSREIKLLSEHHSAINVYMHKYKYNCTNEVEYWNKPKQQEKDISSPEIPQNMSIKRIFSQFLRKIQIKFLLK